MAASPQADSPTGKGKSGNRMRWIIIGGFVLALVGVATGAGLWRMRGTAGEEATVEAADMSGNEALLPLGRITVNVGASGALSEKRTRFLVIEPTLLYDASFDEGEGAAGMASFQPALRDSFIEFLAQLHEDDVYGSAGLSELRVELLRRARLITQSDAPIGILLQDFVLQ